MPLMKNLNGKLVEMTEAEEAAHLRAMPSEDDLLVLARERAIATARDAARIRVIEALVDADPEHQATVAAIEKAASQDEISAAAADVWKK